MFRKLKWILTLLVISCFTGCDNRPAVEQFGRERDIKIASRPQPSVPLSPTEIKKAKKRAINTAQIAKREKKRDRSVSFLSDEHRRNGEAWLRIWKYKGKSINLEFERARTAFENVVYSKYATWKAHVSAASHINDWRDLLVMKVLWNLCDEKSIHHFQFDRDESRWTMNELVRRYKNEHRHWRKQYIGAVIANDTGPTLYTDVPPPTRPHKKVRHSSKK